MALQRKYKSKRKVSTVRAAYRPWKEWTAGDIVVGTYKGSQVDNYDKNNWLIEVEEAFFPKKPKLAASLVGQTLGLNSNGKLDQAMESVEIGETVQVEYKGMSMIEKGKFKGKEAHDVEVDVVEADDGSSSPAEEEELEEDDSDF